MIRAGLFRLVLTLVFGLAFGLAACSKPPETFQGWVEANMIFVAPDETGRLETLSAQEGEHIEAGALLFTVDNDLYTAELRMNEALVENAQQAFDRAKDLLKARVGTQKAYDDAESALRTARARLATAQTRLDRRKVMSPVTGTVQQVYFRPGEMVTAGRPVVAILPPGNLKLRFFVPEAVLPRVAYGASIGVHCDGCADGLTARVSFISRTAEYTPPVIYSLQERAKLVFLIEALPTDPGKLRVGQPIDVSLGPPPDGTPAPDDNAPPRRDYPPPAPGDGKPQAAVPPPSEAARVAPPERRMP